MTPSRTLLLVGATSAIGRATALCYAKAGLTAFLSGLRNRLTPSSLRVVTVKPGFVRTRMTAGLKLQPVLTVDAQEVGQAIFRAAQGRGGDVIYVRRIWRPVMMLIKCIPEPLFK